MSIQLVRIQRVNFESSPGIFYLGLSNVSEVNTLSLESLLGQGFRNKIELHWVDFFFGGGGQNELYWRQAIFLWGGLILEQPSSETYIYFFKYALM